MSVLDNMRLMAADGVKPIVIDYTNWKGERAKRRVLPRSIYYGKTEFHPEKQWLMLALDLGKDDFRIFALRDIHMWDFE